MSDAPGTVSHTLPLLREAGRDAGDPTALTNWSATAPGPRVAGRGAIRAAMRRGLADARWCERPRRRARLHRALLPDLAPDE